MKVGIFGTGDVGRTLANAFLSLGHEVKMGAREAANVKAAQWAKEAGAKAGAGTFSDAAKFGEVIVLATLGSGTESAIRMAGPENLNGKLVLDTTNPLDFSKGMPPSLFVGTTDSLGERIQRAAPGAHVVKCFNTVGNALMFRPKLKGGPGDMFICGNHEGARKRTAALLADFGWNAVDIGGIEGSRYLEPMCLTWVLHGMRAGTWNHAFKFITT
ncbi:MAG: NAD(P)-binding domain-containing protein [Planctomycetes bacterium]|jgi:predicted dinucleotide-binding enzyme|nr:NAD(P)-binding domain-containing protein [Planctomycetota bacterium]MCL4730679.1 NAD(P)-binding domain-containing protein [Planctomycetota bacterium]